MMLWFFGLGLVAFRFNLRVKGEGVDREYVTST